MYRTISFIFRIIGLLPFILTSGSGSVLAMSSEAGEIRVERMVSGLDAPWALDFVPGGGLLITERGGRLLAVSEGQVSSVEGVPRVAVVGQGGLLDVMVPRDFVESREVFLSFSRAGERGGAGTALAVGKLSEDMQRLDNVRVLFEMQPLARGGRHFGSRIVEAPSGHIFMTIGERGDRPAAQDLMMHNGTVIRLNRDGSIPNDNPFVDDAGALPEIWSYGHRNPQGAALDLDGNLWVNEHGARGGDEINRIKAGANYGWPVIAYGRHYSGLPIGEGTTKPGMEQPAHYWDPSIAPSGMMIYSGKLWPGWRGDIFSGSLKFDYISRIDPDHAFAEEELKSRETERVRDVVEAPDGAIWFISEGRGAVFRMVPGNR